MMNLNDIPLEINGGTIISNDNITCRNTKGKRSCEPDTLDSQQEDTVVNRIHWIHNRKTPLLTRHSGFTTGKCRC